MGPAAVVKKSYSGIEDTAPIVGVSEFVKKYRKNTAVSGVDLEVRPGEIYGLIGPDGAGKSSLMKAIAGVLSYNGGRITVFGSRVDSERSAEKVKHRIGFMPQGLGLNLYPELSIEENIDFFARLRLVPEDILKKRKQLLLAMTRLESHIKRPMKKLSGGMKQKLGLVCTLIHAPDLIILDEPTTGVDPVSRRDFWSILTDLLQAQAMTALVSTAYMDEATRFHRMSFMFEGRVVAHGKPDEILALVPGSTIELQVEPQAQAREHLKAHFPQVEVLGPRLRVLVEENDSAAAIKKVENVLSGLAVRNMKSARPELEDAFVALLRKKKLIKADDSGSAAFSIPDKSEGNHPAKSDIDIEAEGLTKKFGEFCAVENFSFQVRQGEIFGLLGANGAGKTTVMKMLTGIMLPTAGSGRVAGADMRTAGRNLKKRIGYMSQMFSLYSDLTVVENIRLYAGVYGLNRRETREQTQWVIGMAGLAGYETKLAGSLPMGLTQRLALGCALVHGPRVVFLDEPTSGVDPVGRRRFWDILFKLSREQGITIMLTTHYMSESEHCDHLSLMYAGRIVADASPAEMKMQLQAEFGHMIEVSTNKPLIAFKLIKNQGFGGVALFGNEIHLMAKDPGQADSTIRTLLTKNSITLTSLCEKPLTMEDVFVNRVTALEKQERNLKLGTQN